ncbi:hypothetical protein GCM10009106_16550 [Sphingomonas japonica]|nr:NepR family anti-sigma factor [Sphingomonas japonica]
MLGDQVEPAKNKAIEPRKTASAKVHRKDKDVGDALRAVYREAIDETIPDEMMTLLDKLG